VNICHLPADQKTGRRRFADTVAPLAERTDDQDGPTGCSGIMLLRSARSHPLMSSFLKNVVPGGMFRKELSARRFPQSAALRASA
jgi:hypothetical protein